jgi:hypothetical protein
MVHRCPGIPLLLSLLIAGLIQGCELGWDFLKEGGGGAGVGAQTTCQSSQVVVGQFPAAGGLFSTGSFTATYSSPNFDRNIPSEPPIGLRISRHRLWLNDLTIEVSFFPVNDTDNDQRNGCLGRALLEINIPSERLFLDDTSIDISSTRLSLTEPSAFYAEGGDPGFTASAVNGTIRLRSVDGSRVEASFDFTFNPGVDPRRLTNGELQDDVDGNPAAEGLQPG